MYTNLSVDIQYKAPNFGQSLLLGVANAFGGCGSFGSLTGLGGFGGFMGSPVGIGMGCGSWSSQIGGILCGTAMNMAGMGYGGYGMGMYGCGGYSTDFAMAQAGANLGTGLVSIGLGLIEKRQTMNVLKKQKRSTLEKQIADCKTKISEQDKIIKNPENYINSNFDTNITSAKSKLKNAQDMAQAIIKNGDNASEEDKKWLSAFKSITGANSETALKKAVDDAEQAKTDAIEATKKAAEEAKGKLEQAKQGYETELRNIDKKSEHGI